MKAIVLGAGIVGITTAYELNRDGHEVTVIDREAEPASFTSYANAGLIAPAHPYAWSSPAAPRILIEVAVAQRPGAEAEADPRSRLSILDVEILAGMHGGEGGAQYPT